MAQRCLRGAQTSWRVSAPPLDHVEAHHERPHVGLKGSGQAAEKLQGWIPAAGFELSDVGPVDRGLQGKPFLAQAQPRAALPNPLPEEPLPGRGAPLCGHPPISRVGGL
jgi:hypothetical protein